MSKLLKSKILLGFMVVAVVLVGVALVAPSTSKAECSLGTTTLKYGQRSEAVRCLQTYLNVVANPTTYFGPLTLAKVKAYQVDHGLTADGLVGSLTKASILAGGGTSPTVSLCPNGMTVASNCTLAPTSPTTPITTGIVSLSLGDQPTAVLLTDSTGSAVNTAVQPVMNLTFANGTAVAVNVNTLKLTRTGIAVDGDVSNLYLYDGNTKVAEMTSVSNKVFTFSNSLGLFTIPANSSKTISVQVNVAAGSTAAYIGFNVVSASDVTISAGTLNGTFPMAGNVLSVSSISDLGYVNLTAYATYPTTISPSSDSQELWRFSATANSQKMNVKKIVLTMVGTIAPADLQDLQLQVGGVQVGATAQIDSNNKVTFDLSSAPYQITSGQSKVFVLMGKVVKGTGRTFKFTVRSNADFSSTDDNYNVDTPPLMGGAALTVMEPTSGTGTSISNGTLTISRSANSPSGNIPAASTDVPLARFDYKANGEDIKVSYIKVSVNEESSDQNIDNGKLYYNGTQVGTTDTAVADETTVTYTLGNTVIIPAGTTGVFEYRADTTQGGGTALAANQTIVVSLVAGTTDATGQTSLSNISTAAATGNTLTVKAGTLSVAKNTAMPDATSVTPTGVTGAVGVKVGSFVITAGTGEGATLTQVVVGDDDTTATSDFGANFQNLTLKHNGVAIAATQGTLTATQGTDYTFNLSPSVTVAAGQTYVIDAYADILTSADGGADEYSTAEVGLEWVSVSATGVVTSTDLTYTNSSTPIHLQKIYIAAYGTLSVTASASTPVAGQMVMGETDATMAMLEFTAGSSEDMNVSVVTITDTTSFGGSVSNIKLYDGSTLLGSADSLNAETNGTATFNLSSDWVIPKNTSKTLTIKATINAYGSAVSGGSHTFNLASNGDITTRGGQSGVAITETVSGATGTAQKVYKTKVVATKASSSPSGSSVVGAGANVLEFNVATDSANAAVLNAVAITMSGSANMTGSGNAYLYKSTDLVTALSTEAYVAATCTGGTTTTCTVADATATFAGIPVGANIRVYDTSGSAYMTTSGGYEVSSIVSTASDTLTFAPAASAAVANTDILYYRPMQPGTGKVYFGAQTTLGADVANADTSLTVTSTDGFSLGDTVTVKGYSAAGAEVTSSAGGVITDISSGTAMTTSAVTVAATIDYDYLSGTAANAITNSQNSAGIAYTGIIGQEVAAGSTMTFVVKGDTTSIGTAAANLGTAVTSATLRADIAAVGDLNWDDKVNYGVITVTKNLPVTGGTLTFTY
jgi:hypothetical protein